MIVTDCALIRMIHKVEELLTKDNNTSAAYGVQALALSDQLTALSYIYKLTWQMRGRYVGEVSSQTFNQAAARRRLSTQLLIDTVTPDLSIDTHSRRLFEFKGRSIEVQVSIDGAFSIRDKDKKRVLKKFPAAAPQQTSEDIKQFKKRW